MKNIIIRKNQYPVRFTLSSVFLVFMTSNILMTNNALALKLALPSITSSLTKNKVDKSLHHSKHNQAPSFIALQSTNDNMLSNFQERFLTYHYGKHERIKAIYDQGAYCISYQQEW